MKTLAILAVAAVASTVFAAQEGNPVPQPVAPSSVTQEQLRSELATFKAGVSPYSMRYNPVATFRSQRTRAEVTAEYFASREEVAAMGREDSGSSYAARPQVAPKLAAK